jgi:hypothetical protein
LTGRCEVAEEDWPDDDVVTIIARYQAIISWDIAYPFHVSSTRRNGVLKELVQVRRQEVCYVSSAAVLVLGECEYWVMVNVNRISHLPEVLTSVSQIPLSGGDDCNCASSAVTARLGIAGKFDGLGHKIRVPSGRGCAEHGSALPSCQLTEFRVPSFRGSTYGGRPNTVILY